MRAYSIPSCVLPVLFLIFLQATTSVNSLSSGQKNVCSKVTYYKASRRESYNQPYRVKTYTWCWAVPPRCTNYLMRYRTAYRQVWETKSRTEYECCRGYAETGGQCRPTCSFSCGFGTCTSPNSCTCHSGYSGYQCNKKCDSWRFGSGCTSVCTCNKPSTERCDARGKCLCKPGYKGDQCQEKCSTPSFGTNCQGVCQCKNSGTCDFITGGCTCQPGWYGAFCEKKCPTGTGGTNCTKCKCQNGKCDSVTGLCSSCHPGWTGTVCSEKCVKFNWGQGCLKICDCNGGECDFANGKCTKCRLGYTGIKCDEPCPVGFFGQDCKNVCPCKNGGKCDPVFGNCTCTDEGYYGDYCEKRYCGSAKVYGINKRCDTPCICQWPNTKTNDAFSCHSIDGKCTCKDGWKGEDCGVPCSPPFYGPQCSKTCNCTNSAYCDPVHGKCYCQLGYSGIYCEHECPKGKFGLGCSESCRCYNNATCNPKTGACNCNPGWSGRMCERTCEIGTHGAACVGKCACSEDKGHGCSPIDGACMCTPGWKGNSCQENCSTGTFGLGCMQNCTCNATNTQDCHSEKGICRCKTGFSGLSCDHACPAGKWGQTCGKTCLCGNATCDKTSGVCECKIPGYKGSTCSDKCAAGTFGLGCQQKCDHCSSYGGMPQKCDPVDGRCVCKVGFVGYFCERSCPSGYYGATCTKKCSSVCPQVEKTWFDAKLGKSIKQNFTVSCDPSSGGCLCPAGQKGNKCQEDCPKNTYGINCAQTCKCNAYGAAECRSSNGLCECKAGYTGPKCTERCPESYYGHECSSKCGCDNAGSVPGTCNMETGYCYCMSGWMRDGSKKQCDLPCSVQSETWGPGCTRPCPKCPPHSQCNVVNGLCDCVPGYEGKDCARQCKYPYFGLNCTKACDKTCPTNFCDFKGGCIDPRKNIGGNTGKQNVEGGVPLTSGSLIGIIVGVILLVVLIVMVGLIFFFRNKIVRLRHDKAISDAMRDDALERTGINSGIGVSNPGYDEFVSPLPLPLNNASPAGPPIKIVQNDLYNRGLEQSAKQKEFDNEENPYDPYNLPTGSNGESDVNVYDEAKIYDNIGDKVNNMEINLVKPEDPYSEAGTGYLAMDSRSPAPLPPMTGTMTGSEYFDPYSNEPKSPDSVYHHAYEVKAPPRITKPPVAKKPNVPARTGAGAPKLPATPDENAYQSPNPNAEDPYHNAYDHAPQNSKALAPGDMDAIMFDGTTDAHVQQPYDQLPNREPYDQVPRRDAYDQVPKRETYDRPASNTKPRPVTAHEFEKDMDTLMMDDSNA